MDKWFNFMVDLVLFCLQIVSYVCCSMQTYTDQCTFELLSRNSTYIYSKTKQLHKQFSEENRKLDVRVNEILVCKKWQDCYVDFTSLGIQIYIIKNINILTCFLHFSFRITERRRKKKHSKQFCFLFKSLNYKMNAYHFPANYMGSVLFSLPLD